ncbi:MAG: 4-hydroxy-tetrahydrodipicolinate synthase [Nitrospirota bacterium]
MFKGSMVPIVTPFRKSGKFDEAAFTRLIKWHIAEGTDAIVPCGTTGESATLDYDEHIRVIEVAVKAAGGKVPVIAGTGANSTDEAIMLTREARRAGADGALLVAPYYNKPTQEGLYLHYRAIAQGVPKLPLILYNVPGRAAVNILPATVARLAKIKNIVGIKDATGDMKQTSHMMRLCPKSFGVYSGDDFTTFTLYALGGQGTISVTANVMPRAIGDMWDAWERGDMEEARRLHYHTDPLTSALFLDTNPFTVMSALAMMKMVEEVFRLPLSRMSAGNKKKLREVLKSYKLV